VIEPCDHDTRFIIAEHNAGVIQELNKREHDLGMHPCAREMGRIEGYNEAIALIRDGVE
jgi:hypothetical protein